MQVRYKGHKPKMVVTLPIGVHNKSGVKETRWADPFVELSPEDARKLVCIDPHNFEIVPGQWNPNDQPPVSAEEPEPEVTVEQFPTQEIHLPAAEEPESQGDPEPQPEPEPEPEPESEAPSTESEAPKRPRGKKGKR